MLCVHFEMVSANAGESTAECSTGDVGSVKPTSGQAVLAGMRRAQTKTRHNTIGLGRILQNCKFGGPHSLIRVGRRLCMEHFGHAWLALLVLQGSQLRLGLCHHQHRCHVGSVCSVAHHTEAAVSVDSRQHNLLLTHTLGKRASP